MAIFVPGVFGITAGTLLALLTSCSGYRIALADGFVACILLFPIALEWALSFWFPTDPTPTISGQATDPAAREETS